MTKTTCPTCGANCELIERCTAKACDIPLHNIYQSLSQPDLTKLKEVYINHMLLVNESAKKIKVDKTKKEILQDQILDSFTEVIKTVKEVLNENC